MTGQNKSWARFSLLLLILGVLILVGTIRPELGGDGDSRLLIVESLLRGQGLPAIKYSSVQPVLSLPIVVLAEYLGYTPFQSARYFNLFVVIALGLYIFWRLGQSRGRQYAIDFCLFSLAASMLHVNISFYYGEVLTALCLVAGFISLRTIPLLAVLFIGIGVANTPVIGVPVLVSAFAFRDKPWPILQGLVLAGLFFCLDTYLKYGGLLSSGYLTGSEKGLKTLLPYSGLPGFSYPMLFGVKSILFSFGKGLLFFIPALLIALNLDFSSNFRGLKGSASAILLFSLTLVLVYSKWWAWYGGMFWGPRFFLVLIFVASALLLATLEKPVTWLSGSVLAVLVVQSTWVGIASVAFKDYYKAPICEADGYQLELLCWYVPEFSPLWRPFVDLGASGVLERLSHRYYHSFVLWQLVVLGYFLYKIYRNASSSVPSTEGTSSP